MFNDIDNRWKWLIFLIITNLVSIGFMLYFMMDNGNQNNELMVNKTIIVQIAGEVERPNVYEIQVGMRLRELIELAGGYTKDANIEVVNEAIELKDEMKITIPKLQEDGSSQTGKVNINTAGLEELMTLRGIGEVKAQSIIDFRETYGYFHSIEEIKLVSGIGDKTYESIKDDICI